MRYRMAGCLVLVLFLVAGCGKNMQKANEIAAQNLYREIAYDNAALAGPSVMVLPGKIACANYEFLTRVKPDALREFGELELGKANFKVMEKSALPAMYQEVELAVNLGDGSLSGRIKKIKAEPPRWIVLFDVPEVKTKTTAFKFTDKNAASFAGAFMGSMFFGSGGAMLGEGLVGSINSAEEQRQWDITIGYRILDGATGEELHQGRFTEQASIKSELKGFLGIDAAESGGVTVSTTSHRLIQKAVQDMDRQYKPHAAAEARAALAADKGKRAKASKTKAQPAARQASPREGAPEIACVKTKLWGFECQLPADWSTGKPPSAVEVALARKPELAELLKQRRGGKSGLIDDIVAFDILRTAGPLVTLSDKESPLVQLGEAMALSGNDLEGRIFVLKNVSGKISPEKLAAAIEGHMRRASVLEPLAVENVEGGGGVKRPIMVYKYIQVERRRELEEKPEWDQDAKDSYKFLSIPHYNNMAMSIVPKGNDLLLVIVTAPEDTFLPKLEGVKKLVGSAA